MDALRHASIILFAAGGRQIRKDRNGCRLQSKQAVLNNIFNRIH